MTDIFNLKDLREEHAKAKLDKKNEYSRTLEEVNNQYPKIVKDLQHALTTQISKMINYKLHHGKNNEDEISLNLNDKISTYVQVYFDDESNIDTSLFYKLIVERLNFQFGVNDNADLSMIFSKVCTNQVCVNTILWLIINKQLFNMMNSQNNTDYSYNQSEQTVNQFLELEPWFTEVGFTTTELDTQTGNTIVLKY